MKKMISLLQSNPYNVEDDRRIAIPTSAGLTVCSSGNIVRCESRNGLTTIFHLSNGTKIESEKSLRFFEEKLIEWDFFKVHKSHIVNPVHVTRYVTGKDGRVVLSDNAVLPIVRRRKDLVEACVGDINQNTYQKSLAH